MAECLKKFVDNPVLFVTDFQKAIKKGFRHVFPYSEFTHCFNHLRRSIERYIDSHPDLKKKRDDWVDFIVGIDSNGTRGIVDLPRKEYEKQVEEMRLVLRKYWKRTFDEYIKASMLKEEREKLDISIKLTTNLAESAHAQEKKILGKKNEIHKFAKKCIKMLESDWKDWTRCLESVHPKWHLNRLGEEVWENGHQSSFLNLMQLYTLQIKEVQIISNFVLDYSNLWKRKKKMTEKHRFYKLFYLNLLHTWLKPKLHLQSQKNSL